MEVRSPLLEQSWEEEDTHLSEESTSRLSNSSLQLRPSTPSSQNITQISHLNEKSTTLLAELQCNAPEVIHFLLAMGILPPWEMAAFLKNSWIFIGAYSFLFLLIRFTLPYFFIVSIVYFIAKDESIRILVEYGILIDSLLFLQVVVLIPFLLHVVQDLHRRRTCECFLRPEVLAYKSFMPTCYVFSSIFLFMIILDLFFKFRLSVENIFRVNLLEYVSICVATVALLFISADCRMCLSLVASLSTKAADNTLTMKELKQTRLEIDHRVKRHAVTISWIVFVAVLNVLYLFVFDIMFAHWTVRGLLELLPWKMASYAKEIAFLMVLFNESAKLNEQADKLVQLVADHNDDYEAELSGSDVENMALRTQVKRLLLLSALTTKPISFPIAGRRWTKLDMLLQVLAVVLTTLIVAIRAVLLSYAW